MPGQEWGPSVSTSSGSKLAVLYDGIKVSGSNATLVNPRIEFSSRSGWSDSTNWIRAQGDAVVDQTWNNVRLGGGVVTLRPQPETVPLRFGSATVRRFEAVVYGVSFFNGDRTESRYSIDVAFPARPYSPPGSPINVHLARINDTTQRFSFGGQQNDPATDRYTQTVDWELQTDSPDAAWVSKQYGLPGNTSLVDVTGTSVNHRYRVRVRFWNSSGGVSSWSTSGWVSTRPAKPTVRNPEGDGSVITAHWSNTAPFRTGSRLGWSENDGAEFDPSISVGFSADSTTRTVDPTRTHRYRVYHLISGVPLYGGGTVTLVSDGSSWSSTVQLQNPPLAPTITFNQTVLDPSVTKLRVTVVHNPVDATKLTAAELRYRRAGTADSWIYIDSGTSTITYFGFPELTAPNRYEFQARTKGAHELFGPWSSSAIAVTSSTPTLAITFPTEGSVILGSALDVSLSFGDPEGQSPSAFDMELLDATQTLIWSSYTMSRSTNISTYRLPWTLLDGASYTYRARARNSVALWSPWVEVTVLVQYAKPPSAVTQECVWHPDSGTVVIEVVVPAPTAEQAQPVSYDLQWFHPERGWVIVTGDQDVLEPDQSSYLTHWTPPTGGREKYRIVTYSDLPSATVGDVFEVDTPADGWVYLSGGPGFTQLARVRGNLSVLDVEIVRDKAWVTPVGRRRPIELLGDATDYRWQVKGFVANRKMKEAALGTRDEWVAVATLPAPLLLRDYAGTRRFVGVEGFSISVKTGEMSITLREVDYDE